MLTELQTSLCEWGLFPDRGQKVLMDLGCEDAMLQSGSERAECWTTKPPLSQSVQVKQSRSSPAHTGALLLLPSAFLPLLFPGPAIPGRLLLALGTHRL